jgi:hypothetical protein
MRASLAAFFVATALVGVLASRVSVTLAILLVIAIPLAAL